ncbi:MAG: MgtC/SapB family protein [Candidatus Aenigmatarchaeota archaeon]
MDDFLIKVVLSVLLGGLIGIEREIRHKAAGIRTNMLVCLASMTFTYFALLYFPSQDAARIIANILVGMGFIGAGSIIKENEKVIGITTAASLWLVTAIGVIIGLGFYYEAILISLVAFFILASKEIYLFLTRKNKW